MDHFNGLKNEDLLAYFLVDLNSRKELIQYTYPHEMIEPQDAIDEHVIRCQQILWHYLYELVSDTAYNAGIILHNTELNKIVSKKKAELHPLLESLAMKYLENIKVIYIDLSKS